MHTIVKRSLLLTFGMSFGLLYGQTITIATVSSSYPVTVPSTFMGTNFTSLTGLGVSYPIGLAPGSYISGTQLNTDFQTFLTNYPNPHDPLEAILGSVLQSILSKYPQMTGGSLYGDITAPCTPTVIGTITIPCSPGETGQSMGSVSVLIGTYNTTTGTVTGLSRGAPRDTPTPVAAVKPAASK